jgi:signal transduction histidine kinase
MGNYNMPRKKLSGIFLLLVFLLIIDSSTIAGDVGKVIYDFPNNCDSKICCLKYHPGDLSTFALVNMDDSNWYQLPMDSPDETFSLDIPKGIGCFRLLFFMEKPLLPRHLGVTVSPLGNAYEIFFNGQKIGARGIVGDSFVEAPRTNALFLLPHEFIKPGTINLIALRVMDTTFNQLKFKDAFQIGFYEPLLIQSIKQNYKLEITEWVFIAFFSIFLIASLFLNLGTQNNGEYIAFTCFVFICLVINVLDSHFFYTTGLKTSFVQQILFLFCVFFAISGIVFLICLYGEPMAPWTKLMLIVYGGYGFMLMLPLPFSIYRTLLMKGTVLLFNFTALAGFYLALKAVLQRRHESIPVLVGISGLAVGAILSCVDYCNIDRTQPFLYNDFAMAFFLLTMVSALMFRYNRLQREVRFFSGKILLAYESERKRLSRDIHDGLGQTLMALKLQLQIMNAASVDASQFSLLIKEVSKAIKELRHISMDLRPAFIENTPFIRLLKYHAASFSQRTGIKVEVEGDQTIEPCVDIKDNLYRICQEALTNVEKHAKADLVNICLKILGKRLMITITDNGNHFSQGVDSHKFAGVGISSMKERSQLMGGQFRVERTSNQGCKIIVEVPYK